MANHHLKNKSLSLKAKGLLSQMLSLPDNWDYTLIGLATINRESIDAIREAVKELERTGYIVRSRERNGKGHLKGTHYTIFERPQAGAHLHDVVKPLSGKPTLENPILDNPTLGNPVLENPTQLNTKKTSTNPLRTNGVNTHLSNPDTGNRSRKCNEGIGKDESSTIKEDIKKSIEYDFLIHRFSQDRLDDMVDLLVAVLCSQRDTITIAGDDYPVSLVKERLRRLNSMHIEYVFECLDKNTTHVRNIKKYLLATLFNAPSTMDSYYRALVNHDFKGQSSQC